MKQFEIMQHHTGKLLLVWVSGFVPTFTPLVYKIRCSTRFGVWQIEKDWILSFVAVFRAGVHLEFLNHLTTQWSFWQHSAN